MKKSFIVIIVTLILAGLIGYGLYSYAKSQGVEFGDSSSYSTPVKSNSEKNLEGVHHLEVEIQVR